MSEEIEKVTREVRDSSGNVIAYVSLPVNSSQAQWEHVLSAFISTADMEAAISLVQSQDLADGSVSAEEEETFWQRVKSYLFG